MELRHLLYFTTIAETASFRRAAERLNISQPPLTVAIRNLEAELGTALFIRGSRGVTLTDAGKVALIHARSALAEADQLRRAVSEGRAGERGQLTIGFVGSAIYELLPRLISLYQRRFPMVDLNLTESTTVEIVQRVCDRQLDVGLVRLPLRHAAGLNVSVIELDKLVAAVPSNNPLARRSSISLVDLKAERFILFTEPSALQRIILSACHHAGFVPQIAQETNQVYTMLSLVQIGLGVALVPSKATRYLPSGVKLLNLREKTLIEAGIVVASERSTPLIRNFLALAVERS